MKKYLTLALLALALAGGVATVTTMRGVIGFYSLVVSEVKHADAPERVAKGMPRYPMPLMVLARLARA
jgi:hypothetical protein